MELWTYICCLFFVYLQDVSSKRLGRHGSFRRGLDKPEPPKYFAIREVRWRLVANSMQGQIEADVEVSNHDDYEVRWYILEPGSSTSRFVQIPVTLSLAYDFYVQRLWMQNRAFISGHMMLHPVPPADYIDIMLEVATNDDGPILRYTFQASVSRYYYAPGESIRPHTMEPVSYSSPKHNEHDGRTATFEYIVRGRAMPEVDIYRGQPADDLTQIFDDFINVADDPQGDMFDIHDVENEFGQIETTVSLTVYAKGSANFYRIVFSGGNESLEYNLLMLPGSDNSFFTEIHMSLETCSGLPYTGTGVGGVSFELSSWGTDCIKCVAAAAGGVTMQITNDGMPVGSGPSHAVFWYRLNPDMATAYFVLHEHTSTYMYQSLSYAGNYACVATTKDGKSLEREFLLDFV